MAHAEFASASTGGGVGGAASYDAEISAALNIPQQRTLNRRIISLVASDALSACS